MGVGTEEGLVLTVVFLGTGLGYCYASTTLIWRFSRGPFEKGWPERLLYETIFNRVWTLHWFKWTGNVRAQSKEFIVPAEKIAFSSKRRLIRITEKWGIHFGPWTSWGFLKPFLEKKRKSISRVHYTHDNEFIWLWKVCHKVRASDSIHVFEI